MTDPTEARRRSPAEIERGLTARLEGRRLVCEVSLSEDELHEVRSLWRNWRRGPTWIPGEIAEEYPAIHAFFMVDYGVRHYESNEFWPALNVGTNDQRRIGERFERALTRFELDRFPQFFKGGRALRFVSIILAHGGIPASMAERFVRHALLPALRGGTETGAELVAEWRASPPAFFPRTISRFLLNGGETAVDLLDRLIELAWTPREGMAAVADRLKIPSHLAAAVMDTPAVDLQRGVALPFPKVTMDPVAGVGPQLVLPPVERTLAPRVVWRVEAGSGASTSLPAFHRAQADPIPLTPFDGWWTATPLIDGQAVRTHRFECFAENPVVCFDDGWTYIPGYAGIRLDRIWVVASGGVTFASVEAQGALRPLTGEREALLGAWRGHVATHLDLAGVDALAALEGHKEQCRLSVRGAASEPALLGTPIADVVGQQGEPIHDQLPQLSLPAGRPWIAAITGPDGVAVERLFEAANEPRSVALSDMADERVGRYEISVQGGLGSGARMIFGLVPGLDVHGPSTPLGPAVGEASVRVEANSDVGLYGLPLGQVADVVIPAGEAREELWTRDRNGKLGLFVSVPRLRWVMRIEGGNEPPAQALIRIVPDEISADGKQAIVVSTGRPDVGVSLAVEVAGEQVQLEGPRRTGQNGLLVFPLDDLRDVFRLHAASEVRLLVVTGSQRFLIGRHQPTVVARAERTGATIGDKVLARVVAVSNQRVSVEGDGWTGVIYGEKLPLPIDEVAPGDEFMAVVMMEDDRGLKLDARIFDPARFPTGRTVTGEVVELRANYLRLLVEGHDAVVYSEALPADRPIGGWKAGDKVTGTVAGINRDRRQIRLRVTPFDPSGLTDGSRVMARVVGIGGDRIFVDADGVPGVIFMKDWAARTPARIGESVETWVVRVNRGRGHLELTSLAFNRLGLREGGIVEVTVVAIAGEGIRVELEDEESAWIPFDELPPHLQPADLEKSHALLSAMVTRVDEARRNIVLSVVRATSTYTFGGDSPPESPFAVLRQNEEGRQP